MDLHTYLSEIGRKGGQSRSDKKIAAGKINAAKALAARKKTVAKKTCQHKRLVL